MKKDVDVNRKLALQKIKQALHFAQQKAVNPDFVDPRHVQAAGRLPGGAS